MKHLGGPRGLLLAILSLVVAGAGVVPPAAGAPTSASETLGSEASITQAARPDVELGEDYVLPPAPPGGPDRTVPNVDPRLATKGWNRLETRYHMRLLKTYKMRLSGKAAKLRGAFENVVLDVPNTDITVMPGKVKRTKPRRGEILVVISDRSPCTSQAPNWWGCGGPSGYRWVKGSNYRSVWATKGKIWIRPVALTNGTTNQKRSLYRHELGHVLGLAHQDATYKGKYQVMTTYLTANPPVTYQRGDRNGLRYGRKIEVGHRNFRVGAVEALKVRKKKWLFGVDATGHMWAWQPRKGKHRWKRLPGRFRGAPAAFGSKRKVHLYAVGRDGRLRHIVRKRGDWKKWNVVATTAWKGGVDAVRAGGNVHVFGRSAASGSMQHAWQSGGSWTVQDLGGVLIGDVAALYLPKIPAYSVWGVGTGGGLFQQNYVNGAWSGWSLVPGAPSNFEGSLSVTRDRKGQYRIVGVSTSGDILQARWNGSWHFGKKKAKVRGRIDLLPSGKKRIRVYAPDRTGILRTSKQTKRGWSGLKAVKPR